MSFSQAFDGARRTRGILGCFWYLAVLAAPIVASADTIPKIFDGKPKILNVVHHWSWGLQGPISGALKRCNINYIKIETNNLASPSIDNNLQPINTMNLSWQTLSFPSDTPTIVIGCAGPGYPIYSPGDTAKINLGVRKVQTWTKLLKDRGADLVFATSHHYSYSRFRTFWNSTTPPAGDRSDTLVYNAYNKLLGKRMAINVTTLSAAAYPYHLISDLEHMQPLGEALYGALWCKALYEYDGVESPKALDDWIASARQQSIANFGYVKCTVVRPARLDTVRWGDSLVLDYEVTDSNRVYQTNPPTQTPKYCMFMVVGFVGAGVGQFVIKDSIPATMKKRFTFRIPDSAKVAAYPPAGVPNKFPLYVDSACIVARAMTGQTCYAMSKSFILTDRSGKRFTTGVDVGPVEFARGPSLRTFRGSLSLSGVPRGTVARVFNLRGRLIRSFIVTDPYRAARLDGLPSGPHVVAMTLPNGTTYTLGSWTMR